MKQWNELKALEKSLITPPEDPEQDDKEVSSTMTNYVMLE